MPPKQRGSSGVPDLTPDEVVRFVAQAYSLSGNAAPLPSERDQNVLFTSADGQQYVVKISNAHEERTVVEGEVAALAHLATRARVPRVVPTNDQTLITQISGLMVRLMSVVPGTPLARARRRSDNLHIDVGHRLAELDTGLAHFDHPGFHRHLRWDLARGPDIIEQHVREVKDAKLRRIIKDVASFHAEHVIPNLPALRQSVIHGDANDYNVLVDDINQQVNGIIDFGDMVFSHTVNNVAIAMAYVALGSEDPLASAAAVLRGYHRTFTLSETEVGALFSLMRMRLAVSACIAAEQREAHPNAEYLAVSQEPIRRVLPLLAQTHPRFAHYTFRAACGWDAVPHSHHVVSWLRTHRATFAPLVGVPLHTVPLTPLDFSAGSTLIHSDPSQNEPGPLNARIKLLMTEHESSIGVGGYDEARLIYQWPDEATQGEPRTIHMGLDVSMAAGTPLFAPLDGTVHAFENAAGRHDYGPVIVLRHVTDDPEPVEFFVLYGHLTLDSLEGLKVGDPITKGQEFARIGAAPSNGEWWDHVHVQLIVDMLDVPCNVNGAARASQRAVWRSICPDPNYILDIPPRSLPHAVPVAQVAAQRRALLGGNLSVSYAAAPLHVVRGYMQYLYDDHAHRFLDAYNNVAHVGHSHPRVVRAVSEQLAVLNTNTRYLQDQLTTYAGELVATFPKPLKVCFFTASGSEANELALRLARAYTGNRDLIVMDAAYHGHTTTLIDISPYKHAGPGGRGAPDWVHTTPIPDVYRNRDVEGEPGPWFAQKVGDVIARLAAADRKLCGYIAETCPSVGGQIILPDGFLADTYSRVRAAGGLCIADEVQTGFGRLGTHFWGFEQQHVVPDIVVLGKPIANGYPMGAVVTTRAIADAFNNGMEYFSTFGGSTAACVAALATLRVTRDEQLQGNALAVGTHLIDGLRAMRGQHPLIGDVRGSGLFIGVELVRDRASRSPAANEATHVANRMRELGVLIGTDGPLHNVLKLRGPLCMTVADADRILETMHSALSELA